MIEGQLALESQFVIHKDQNLPQLWRIAMMRDHKTTEDFKVLLFSLKKKDV